MEQGDSSSLPTIPRLSSQVYSFEENMQNQDEGSIFKRSKKPPMAQLDCFEELVHGFPDEIVRNVNERKSPAAFFASWYVCTNCFQIACAITKLLTPYTFAKKNQSNLEVFKRHMDFGKLGIASCHTLIDHICWHLHEHTCKSSHMTKTSAESIDFIVVLLSLAEWVIAELFNGPCHVLEAFLSDNDKIWQVDLIAMTTVEGTIAS